MRTAWSLVGICLAAVLLLEFTLRLLGFVKDTWIDPPFVNHGVFQDTSAEYQSQPWVPKYESEYSASWVPEWHSYVYWRRPSHHGDYINIDSNGVRRTWSAPAAPGEDTSTRKRIFIFGGSTIWGTGARDDYTIPSFIAKQLADAGLRTEVINYGESAYVTTQEVVTLLLRLAESDVPDAVVFYDGFNDTFTAYQNGIAGIPQNEFNRRAEFRLLNDPERIRREFLKQLPGELYGLQRLARATRHRFGYRDARPEERPTVVSTSNLLADDVVRTYAANIKTVKALGDAYGFRCCFFWQPALVNKKVVSTTERRWSQQSAPWKDFYLSVCNLVQKSETLVTTSQFENLSSIFDEDASTVFIDWAHVTEVGNENVAKRISQDLMPLLHASTSTSVTTTSQLP